MSTLTLGRPDVHKGDIWENAARKDYARVFNPEANFP